MVVSALIFYALMTAVGLGILAGQDLSVVDTIFGDGKHGLRDAGLGLGSGLMVVLLTWFARNLKAVKALNAEFRESLGTPNMWVITVLAVTSSVGEEVLFRGGLQPLIGFWLTVLIFGFVHGGAAARYRVWALFATAAGVLLGWLTEFTGNLLAPMLCHFTVNYFNLHLVTQTERTES